MELARFILCMLMNQMRFPNEKEQYINCAGELLWVQITWVPKAFANHVTLGRLVDGDAFVVLQNEPDSITCTVLTKFGVHEMNSFHINNSYGK